MVLFVPVPAPRGSSGSSQSPVPPPLVQSKELDPQFAPVTYSSPSPSELGAFGQSVALASGFAVVGAPDEKVDGDFYAGHAYIEDLLTNTVTQLTSPNAQIDGAFGYSVATNGALVVVGAPGESPNSAIGAGAAYVFNASGGLVASISDPSGQAPGDFGEAVAIDGNSIVIGAPLESDLGNYESGNAYLYDVATKAIREISSPVPQEYGEFGESVAISGNLVAVGAPLETSGVSSEAGNAYVFSFLTGNDISSLANPTPTVDADFGQSLALNGTTLVVGAPGTSSHAGIVYQINLVTNAVSTLSSPSPTAFGAFGTSVAVDGVTVLVGASGETSGGQSLAGNAYLFSQLSGALITSDFNAPTWPKFGHFGQSVAQLGSTILIGAPDVNASGLIQAGLAYLYSQIPLTLNTPNPTGGGELGRSTSVYNNIWVTGAPDETSGGLTGAGNVYEVRVLPEILPPGTMSSLSVRTLTSPNAVAYGAFGYSVVTDGSWLVVGAPGETAGGFARAGNVYIYNAFTGALLHTLSSPNAQTGGEFGSSVTIVPPPGNIVIVGAPDETATDSDAGHAYAFFANTGSLISTMSSPNPVADGYFGTSVAASGIEALIGAPSETVGASAGAGHAYLFTVLTPTLIATLTSPNIVSYGEFGTSVALFGLHAVVGAPGEDPQGLYGAGRAYLYNNTGALLGTLVSPNPGEGGEFGDSVSTNTYTVVVGAPAETALGNYDAGNVYVFTEGGIELDRYYSPSAVDDGFFGWSVSDSLTQVAVGALYGGGSGSPGSSVGQAYVFGFELAPIDRP